jgi:hypothetical protein
LGTTLFKTDKQKERKEKQERKRDREREIEKNCIDDIYL